MNASPTGRDPLARVLELGLAATVILTPLPFASVHPRGRLAFELGALALGALWTLRAALRPTRLPLRAPLTGLIGLVLLACVQVLPLTPGAVDLLAPRVNEIRSMTRPSGGTLDVERELIGSDPAGLVPAAALSLDPGATASALRTGVSLALLFLVATTVAATRGVKRLFVALLFSAAFQALYGLIVLASGHDRIWDRPKVAYLDSATGTFINRNHFACFLAMALACGMALILNEFRKRRRDAGKHPLVALLGGEGSRNLILALLLVLGLAGLLASLSRAGTALGLCALLATILAAGRAHRVRTRAVITVLIVAVAAVPVVQLGADRLAERYARSAEDFTGPGNRGMVWSDTLSMAAAHPLFGTGYGTFAASYPLYRSPEVRKFFAHAHNDLLQALAEGGAIGALFLSLLLVPLSVTGVRALAGAKGTLGVGLAAGLAALLLHGLIDFNFHIPANLATGVILAGALLGLPWIEPD